VSVSILKIQFPPSTFFPHHLGPDPATLCAVDGGSEEDVLCQDCAGKRQVTIDTFVYSSGCRFITCFNENDRTRHLSDDFMNTVTE